MDLPILMKRDRLCNLDNLQSHKMNFERMLLMRVPKDPRASRPGLGGDPWRLVSKWNLIEDYPDVSFAAFTSDENI